VESEHNEVDGMKKGVDSKGAASTEYSQEMRCVLADTMKSIT